MNPFLISLTPTRDHENYRMQKRFTRVLKECDEMYEFLKFVINLSTFHSEHVFMWPSQSWNEFVRKSHRFKTWCREFEQFWKYYLRLKHSDFVREPNSSLNFVLNEDEYDDIICEAIKDDSQISMEWQAFLKNYDDEFESSYDPPPVVKYIYLIQNIYFNYFHENDYTILCDDPRNKFHNAMKSFDIRGDRIDSFDSKTFTRVYANFDVELSDFCERWSGMPQ